MKKKLIIVAAAVLALTFCLCACSGKGLDSYKGKTYEGTSPWGEKMSITVDNVGKDTVDITYCEKVDGEDVIKEELKEIPVSENAAAFAFEKKASKDGTGYEYAGTLEFKDGKILVTYVDGQATEYSPAGGGALHQVGALSDKQKTVTLECK